MRSDAVRATGGYADASVGEDWSLGAALLWRGPVGWSERPGRLYRKHSVSILQRHSAVTHLLERARATRARLRRDQAVPHWCRLLLPLIAAAQYALIYVVRPLLALPLLAHRFLLPGHRLLRTLARASVGVGALTAHREAAPVADPPSFLLRVGAIRQRALLQPKMQVWCRSALDWAMDVRDISRFPKGQGN